MKNVMIRLLAKILVIRKKPIYNANHYEKMLKDLNELIDAEVGHLVIDSPHQFQEYAPYIVEAFLKGHKTVADILDFVRREIEKDIKYFEVPNDKIK